MMVSDPRATIIDVTPDGSVRPAPSAALGWVLPRWLGLSVIAMAVGLTVVLTLWLAVTILPIVAVIVLAWIVVARLKGVRFGGARFGALNQRR